MDEGVGDEPVSSWQLDCSISSGFWPSYNTNLSAKHRLLQEYFPGAQAAELLAQSPRLWSYRYARLESRLSVLKSHNQLSKLADAMTLGLDAFSRRFPGT